jgi:large subunit ribosomal protein L28
VIAPENPAGAHDANRARLAPRPLTGEMERTIFVGLKLMAVLVEVNMSKTCDVCGKHPVTGRQVSHAHNVSARIFYPNLRTIKTDKPGRDKIQKICMKCLKAQARV